MTYYKGNVGINKVTAAYHLDIGGDANISGVYCVNGVDILASKFNTTDQYKLFNNMGAVHHSYQDFNSPPNFGFWFIQETGNSPATNGATQYYCINQGLGNEYPWTGGNSYGMQIGIPRNVNNPYISIRYKENNSHGSWSKISAGHADTITTTQVTTQSMINNDTQSYTEVILVVLHLLLVYIHIWLFLIHIIQYFLLVQCFHPQVIELFLLNNQIVLG